MGVSDLALKVARRYIASLPVTLERRVENVLTRVHGVKGAIVLDYSQPSSGVLDVAAEAVLVVKEQSDAGPVKFAAPVRSMEVAMFRALRGLGAEKVNFQGPKLQQGAYDSDTVMVNFMVSDAP